MWHSSDLRDKRRRESGPGATPPTPSRLPEPAKLLLGVKNVIPLCAFCDARVFGLSWHDVENGWRGTNNTGSTQPVPSAVQRNHFGKNLRSQIWQECRSSNAELTVLHNSVRLTPSRALQELVYFGSNNACNAFTTFIDARQNAGCPVTMVRPSPDPAVL